jgi:hypothetical protein
MKEVRSRVQDLQQEVQALNIILSQLDEPINRSATQLSKVVDHLESEWSFFFQIIESLTRSLESKHTKLSKSAKNGVY